MPLVTDSVTVDMQRYQQLSQSIFGDCLSLEYQAFHEPVIDAVPMPDSLSTKGRYFLTLHDSFDAEVGRLLITVSDSGVTPLPECTKHMHEVIRWVADSIVGDIEREREMDGMAEDLSYRYEELNLVYALEELTSTAFDFKQGNIFEHLSGACLRYLGVDDAFFLVRDFTRVRNNDPSNTYRIESPHYDRNALANELFAHLRNDSRTLVCNYTSDSFWSDATKKQEVRIIGAPVFDLNHQVYGVFVVVNSLRKPEYTNGDRRIVEVLASHASNTLISYQDELTGLYNQHGFEIVLNNRMSEVTRSSAMHSLVFLEIDNFVTTSDSLGVEGTSKFSHFVAHLLKSHFREGTLLGRIGKSEFVVKLKTDNQQQLTEVIAALQEHIGASRFHWGDKMVDSTISAGVADVTQTRGDFSHFLGAARIACNVAVDRGKSQLYIPTKDDPVITDYKERVDYLQEVTQAIEQNRLHLYLQPIVEVSVGAGEIFRYEVLLRVEDKDGNIRPPDRLISVAEEFSVMPQVDKWVVHHALTRLTQCTDETVRFAINLSGQSLNHEFAVFLEEELNSHSIEPSRICFEITETAMVSNLTAAVELIKMLRSRGCRTSLDDFGSGMSSFSYLQTIPVDYLKIDGSFVKGIVDDSVSYAMVDAINRIGLSMRICTVAEYVEDESVLNAIREIGVHYGQGYGLGRPQPMEEVLALREKPDQAAQAG